MLFIASVAFSSDERVNQKNNKRIVLNPKESKNIKDDKDPFFDKQHNFEISKPDVLIKKESFPARESIANSLQDDMRRAEIKKNNGQLLYVGPKDKEKLYCRNFPNSMMTGNK